jgi:hypothetical protein
MIEILINKRKWLISGLYRPQSINDNNFNKDFIDTFDKISTLYDNVLILGDINYDMLSEHKGAPLKNVCDIFDFVLIRISIMMDSIVLHSSLFFLSQAKSDRT